jgi:glyoxylase-like metal-dependent hydrolase (beta-lactamase superfamily II)
LELTVKLYAITCGHLTIPTAFLLANREGATRVPITSYLIDHPRGRVVFDSGLHINTQHNPAAHVGEVLAAFHQFDYGTGEDIGARLTSIDVDPASVTHVVNSHLHFDHCGGNGLLPNATVVVQRPELDAAKDGGDVKG